MGPGRIGCSDSRSKPLIPEMLKKLWIILHLVTTRSGRDDRHVNLFHLEGA